jgi:hypothetical protein
MTRAERLALALTDRGPEHPLTLELVAWLAASSRVRDFAEAYQAKIHKKFRNARDDASLQDVRAELAVAASLLTDRRFTVAFEAYGAGKAGPDLTVTFRTTATFDVEVTRPRRTPDETGVGAILLAKLRQLTPSTPNVLVIAVDSTSADAIDLAAAARTLRTQADARDGTFLRAAGFEGSRAFYERYLRLGAVLVWCESADGEARANLWINRSARIALPDPAAKAMLACLRQSVSR